MWLWGRASFYFGCTPQILVWLYDSVQSVFGDVCTGALLDLPKLSGVQSGSPLCFMHLHQHGTSQPEQGEVLNLELLGGDVELGAVGGDPDPSFFCPL